MKTTELPQRDALALRFGRMLREARRGSGLDQATVGKRLGVSQPVVSRWEAGWSVPDVVTAAKLADMLGFSLDEARRAS